MEMTDEERRERIRKAVQKELSGKKEVDSINLGLYEEVPENIRVSKKEDPEAGKAAARAAGISVLLIIALVIVLVLFVKLLALLSS